MMAKGTYATMLLATDDLDATFERWRPAAPRSSRSRPTSRTACATAPSATPPATCSASSRAEPEPLSLRLATLAAPTLADHLAARSSPHDLASRTETRTSMATPKDAQPTAAHAADSHDLIRVQGARENNLKDVSVEIPKRRLTVFTGVSGSGKSSLVFATIAAESQRMINETYSAFVQGFMPNAGAARGRRARGADDGDHRRPGADGRQPPLHGRHGHRRQRDAAHPVQPARQAVRRPADGVLLQRPDAQGERGDEHREGRRPGREGRRPGRGLPRRHVPALRGHGQRSATST